jgi:hypothetical protein
MARFVRLPAPEIGVPEERPVFPVDEYETRLAAAAAALPVAGLDVLVVYGDREHCATIAYLTGVDPRFEEALLLLDRSGRRWLLVGNEGLSYGPDAALGVRIELFQDLSLPGQPRDKSRSLRAILDEFGISTGTRVGCVGWKSLSPDLVANARFSMEIPSYVVDLLRDLTGSADLVANANWIFADRARGLRLRNSAAQIAQYEYAASITSSSVLRATGTIAAGIREWELEAVLKNRGLPLTCHTMVSFGAKTRRALSSPSDRRAEIGDPYFIAYGLQGSLTCRAGAVAAGPHDLDPGVADYFVGLVSNYFDVMVSWLRSMRVGVTGGEVFDAVDRTRDRSLFEFALNPGHYLALDEWVESPFRAGDRTELGSGTVYQTDVIPVPLGPHCVVNIEDGVALADGALRQQLQTRYPGLWERVIKRRAFLSEQIGVRLDESVLPLSNTPLWHAPYALSPDQALVL